METIFSTPMRNNNNTRYESGDRRLGDVIDFQFYQRIGIKIAIENIQPGDSILFHIHFDNGGQIFKEHDYLITEVADHYWDYAAGQITVDTMVNGYIHTNGRARYSVDIVAFEQDEDFPDRPDI